MFNEGFCAIIAHINVGKVVLNVLKKKIKGKFLETKVIKFFKPSVTFGPPCINYIFLSWEVEAKTKRINSFDFFLFLTSYWSYNLQ